MAASLPVNVNLLTFEPWKQPSTYLVRFEHIFEKNEDSQYSSPVSFNLEDAFSKFSITSVRETTLGANQWKEDSTRLKFFADPVPVPEETSQQIPARSSDDRAIVLNPMEIRTFVIEMDPK